MPKPFDPRSTVFTNLMLDIVMPSLSPNAWKIICFAMRKTAGWADASTSSGRKEVDAISISQFRTGCGISSNTTVALAIDECVDRKYLLRDKTGKTYRYRLNVRYEIPDDTETVLSIDTETVLSIDTETVNTNSKANSKVNSKKDSREPQQILQPSPVPPAKESSNMATADKYKKRTEEALFASLTRGTLGYAHEYPEEIRPVIVHLESRWNLKAPHRARSGKGKEFAYWVESSRSLLEACAEFGVGALEKLRDDFEAYMSEHGGVAPHTVSSPNSLVNSMRSKAALLRGGNTAPMWGSKKFNQPVHQTRLDV